VAWSWTCLFIRMLIYVNYVNVIHCCAVCALVSSKIHAVNLADILAPVAELMYYRTIVHYQSALQNAPYHILKFRNASGS